MSHPFQSVEIDPAVRRNESPEPTRREAERRPGGAALADQPSSIDPQTIAAAVESNRAVVFGTRRIEFNYDRDINRVVVTVKSDETEEVVRQIPPDDYLKFLARFRETIGILFDEVA